MAGGAQSERPTLGEVIYVVGAGWAPNNIFLVHFTKDLVSVRDPCVLTERAGGKRVAICKVVFFHYSALLFLHCSTVNGIRQVVKRRKATVSVAPRIPPSALQTMAGKILTPLSVAKEAVCI